MWGKKKIKVKNISHFNQLSIKTGKISESLRFIYRARSTQTCEKMMIIPSFHPNHGFHAETFGPLSNTELLQKALVESIFRRRVMDGPASGLVHIGHTVQRQKVELLLTVSCNSTIALTFAGESLRCFKVVWSHLQ